MSVIFIALPIALLLAGAALAGFIWAVRGGQFDDLDSPAVRVVVEEDGSEETGMRTQESGTPSVRGSPHSAPSAPRAHTQHGHPTAYRVPDS